MCLCVELSVCLCGSNTPLGLLSALPVIRAVDWLGVPWLPCVTGWPDVSLDNARLPGAKISFLLSVTSSVETNYQ